jgi:hypothetical protein
MKVSGELSRVGLALHGIAANLLTATHVVSGGTPSHPFWLLPQHHGSPLAVNAHATPSPKLFPFPAEMPTNDAMVPTGAGRNVLEKLPVPRKLRPNELPQQ